MRTVRVSKTKELKAKDFYQTNPRMVRALFLNYDMKGTILDPCAGAGVIKDNSFKKDMTEWDLYPQHDRIEKKDFIVAFDKFDNIVMNPPYSNKYLFINHALEVADRVFVLLPLDTSNYNIFHKDFLNTPKYAGRLLMTPKVMLSETTEWKAGGNSSYAWYEFTQKPNPVVKYEKYADLELK